MAETGTRTAPCLHLTDVLALTRCQRHEDDPIHDPLGEGRVHPYSPEPNAYAGEGEGVVGCVECGQDALELDTELFIGSDAQAHYRHIRCRPVTSETDDG